MPEVASDLSTKEAQRDFVRRFCQQRRALPWLPLLEQQQRTSRDRPVKGPVWISRGRIDAPPEPDLKNALYSVLERLQTDENRTVPINHVSTQSIYTDFIGPRPGVAADAPEPDMDDISRLRALERDCSSDMTILYVHGGGLIFSSPMDYRGITTKLAKLTGARVVSVGYRLSPQNAFPAAILDMLLAYTSLLYPPPGATYSASPAEKIIFAGNSAGVTLCLSLIKFLLEWSKKQPDSSDAQLGPDAASTTPISFHGRVITQLPLPAGLTLASGWCDPCDALPSWHANGEFDYLGALQPACMPAQPPDSIWPSTPPREHPYCPAAMLDHELVCPAAVRDWTGAPPMWIAVGGEERVLDSNRAVATRAARCGVPVRFLQYEGMPHEFAVMAGSLPQAAHCFDQWADACRSFIAAAANGGTDRRTNVLNAAKSLLMPDCREQDLGSPADLFAMSHEEVRRRMLFYNAKRPVWTSRLKNPKL